MSKTVDERVVSMRFDNSQFEANVRTSMSTLDKLKQSLNFKGASKGLDNLNSSVKNVNMSALSSGIETVKAKFSALEVVGVTALANITNSAVNAGKRLVSSLTIDQVTAGWSKYEEKTASVQAIMNATGKSIEEVNTYLDELMWYSDETSYGFTDMTASLGQLTSAGGDIEKLVPMIEGVANATAFAGKSAGEFSRAIYNLNQSYGAGYLQLMDWKSLELAGVASKQLKETLIDTAVAMGKIKKGEVTIANFSETLKKKWADTSVMEAAFGKFSELTQAAYKAVQSGEYDTASEAIEALSDKYDELGATAFKAAQEAKSFSEVIDATKDAVSTGWMKTSELIFGNYDEAKKLWTDMANSFYDIFASGSESRNDILSDAMNSKWNTLVKKMEEAGVSAETFESKIKETAKEHGIAIDDLIKEYGSLGKVISAGKLSKGVIVETIKKLAGYFDKTTKAVSVTTDKLEHFQSIVNKVIKGDFGSGADRVEALTKAGENYATVQGLVNKIWERTGGTWSDCTLKAEDLTGVINDLSKSELQSMGYTEEQADALKELAKQAEETGTPINELIKSLEKPSGRELLVDTIHNSLEAVSKVVQTFKGAWSEIFTPERVSSGIYKMLEALNSFSKSLIMSDETADKLRRTLKGLFAVFDIISTVVGGVFKIAFKIAKKVLHAFGISILDVTASLGDAIVKFHDWLFENSIFAKVLDKVTDIIVRIIKKVKEWFSAFKELPWVQKALSKFNDSWSKFTSNTVDTLVSAVKKIKEWFTAFKNLPYVQHALLRFKSMWTSSISDLGDYFSGGIERIKEFIEQVKSMDSITLNDISGILRNFKERVIDYFTDFSGRFEDAKKAVSDFKDAVVKRLTETGGKFDWLKEKIVGFVKNIKDKLSGKIGFGEILTIGVGAGLIVAIKKISDVLKKLASPLSMLGSIGDGITGVLGSISGVLGAFAKKIKAEALLKIAIAIGVLAAAVWVLAQVPSDRLWPAIGALSALAGVLVVLAVAMKFLGKGTVQLTKSGITKSSNPLLSIAAALGILVLSLKVMESLDPNRMQDNLFWLGVMAAGLAAFAIGLSKVSPELSKGSVLLIAIAVALRILVGVFADLEKLNIKDTNKTVFLFGTLVAGLAIVAMACKGLKAGSVLPILGIAIALKLLVGVFDDIANLDIEKMKSNIVAFIAVIGTLAGLMLVASLGGKNAAKAGLGVLAMAAGLILLIGVIKMLASMNASDLKKGLKAVSQLLIIFGVVVAMSKFAGEHAAKAGVMLLAMSGALLILTAVIVILSHVEAAGLKRALGAITMLSLVFAALIAITRFAGDAKQVQGTLIVLAVTLGIMAIALGTLSMINPENLASATIAISTVIGMFALLVASTHFAQKATGTLIVMTVAIGLLGAILYVLAGLPVESTLGAASALSILLLSLSASMFIISKAGEVSMSAMGSLAIMMLIVAGLAAIIGVLAYLNVGPVLEIAASLSVLILALSASCLLVSHVPVAGAVEGALGLAAFIGIMAGVLAILGGLAQIPGLKELVEDGGEFLSSIGYALGNFVGSIIGGFGAGLTAGLPDIATNLSKFMINLTPFIVGARLIDESAMNGVKALAETLLILTGASLLEKITSWITGGSSLADFATQLVPFGEAIAKFSATVKGNIDAEAVTAAANAGKIMAEMAHTLPNSGGVAGFFAGENDMIDFAAQLVPFGEAIVAFSSTVKDGVDEEAVTAAANAGKIMAEMAETLPNSGGVLGFFAGENDMADFAAQLVPFGEAIVSFSAKVKDGVDEEAVTAAANAGRIMASMADTIPNSGGVVGFFAGENDLDDFGLKIVSFGESMAEFSSKVSGKIDPAAVVAAASTGLVMSKLAENLPKDPSIWERITGKGNQSLSSFAKQLPPFGEAMGQFSEKLGNKISPSKIKAAADAGRIMANMATSLGNADDISGLSDLSEQLEPFGEAIANFSSKVADMDTTSLATNIENFKNAIRSMATVGKSGFDEFVKSITNSQAKVAGSINRMLIAAIKVIIVKRPAFSVAGKSLMAEFVRALGTNKKSIASAFNKNLSAAVAVIKTYYGKFYGAGQYVVMGFVNGIDANTYKAEGKAAAMALKAEAAAKAALNAHSPSKKFYKVGTYAGQGFVNALDDFGSQSYKAGFGMAENARTGLSKAISTVRDFIDSGMDDQLTIRPVLDLTDVTAGANRLNSLFDTNPSVGVLSNVRSVSSMMNRNQNGANGDIISAIKDLGKKIGSSSGDTYSINGITYDDGSAVSEAVRALTRAVRIEGRT